MQPFLETGWGTSDTSVHLRPTTPTHHYYNHFPFENCPGLWLGYKHIELWSLIWFSHQGFSLFALQCWIHICLVPCNHHRHVRTPRFHHLVANIVKPYLTTVSPPTWSYVSIKPAHQISQMSHCFKGLWIILNERVRGQKCNIVNILIFIDLHSKEHCCL